MKIFKFACFLSEAQRFFFFFFLKKKEKIFLFYIGVQPMNDVIFSGAQ